MKLYYSPGACSLAPHIALREAGLRFDLVKVDLAAKKTESGADFLAVNPKGQVPTLDLGDGEVLTEVAVILQYVADQAPGAKLMPAAGSRERYRLAEWLNYIATEVHKGFGPLWKPNTPAEYKAIVKDNLARQFAYLDKALAGRDFIAGKSFSVADAYLFTILNWSRFHQIDLSKYANVKAFMDRIAAREQVRQALDAEGLLKAA
jgi:glutathione S-transferase